jgi:hypothetical protein
MIYRFTVQKLILYAYQGGWLIESQEIERNSVEKLAKSTIPPGYEYHQLRPIQK